MYENVGRPYSFAGPVYPLFLATIFTVTFASPPSWNMVAAIANMVVTVFLVFAVYFLAQKLFNRNVAILSAIVTALLPSLYWYSMRPLPYPLFFLLVVVTFIAANRASGPKGWLFVGVLAALAHLTHGSGILVIAAFLTWCLIRKRFKDSLFLFLGYIILMLPWMIRNQVLLGDFGLGLSIPGKTLIGLFGINNPEVTLPGAAAVAQNFDVFKLMLNIPVELSVLYSMVAIVALILSFTFIGFWFYERKRVVLPHLIFLIFSLLGYIYLGFSLNSNTVETKYLMASFLVLIPVSMYGFNRLFSLLFSKFKKSAKKFIYLSAVFVILMVMVISLVSFSINLNKNYNLPMAETSEEMHFHAWVRAQNLPSETIVLTNAPHVLFLRTGLASLYLYSDDANSTQIEWLIDRYTVNYIALYHYSSIEPSSLSQLNEVLTDRNITELYSSQNIRFYRIDEFSGK